MSSLKIILALLLLACVAKGDEIELPAPPTGQVLDTQEWFDAESRGELESELARLRATHGVDVLVVIWNRAVSSDTDLLHLAGLLGQTWSREDQWAVVLYLPESQHPPLAVWGGTLFDAATETSAEPALRTAITRGLKEWTDPARVSGVALNVAEELVFLRLRRQAELAAKSGQLAAEEADPGQSARARLIRYTLLFVGVSLVIVLVAVRRFYLRSPPKEFEFPPTEWRRRLGADWSGGGTIISSFTPPNGD